MDKTLLTWTIMWRWTTQAPGAAASELSEQRRRRRQSLIILDTGHCRSWNWWTPPSRAVAATRTAVRPRPGQGEEGDQRPPRGPLRSRHSGGETPPAPSLASSARIPRPPLVTSPRSEFQTRSTTLRSWWRSRRPGRRRKPRERRRKRSRRRSSGGEAERRHLPSSIKLLCDSIRLTDGHWIFTRLILLFNSGKHALPTYIHSLDTVQPIHREKQMLANFLVPTNMREVKKKGLFSLISLYQRPELSNGITESFTWKQVLI